MAQIPPPVGPLLFSKVVTLCPEKTVRTIDIAVGTDVISSTLDADLNMIVSTEKIQYNAMGQPSRIVRKERPRKTRRNC